MLVTHMIYIKNINEDNSLKVLSLSMYIYIYSELQLFILHTDDLGRTFCLH